MTMEHLKISNVCFCLFWRPWQYWMNPRWWQLRNTAQARLAPPPWAGFCHSEVTYLSLRNKLKAAKLYNFENCDFTCKLRKLGTQQFLTQILFSTASAESNSFIDFHRNNRFITALFPVGDLEQFLLSFNCQYHMLPVIQSRSLATDANCGISMCLPQHGLATHWQQWKWTSSCQCNNVV